MVVVAVCVAVVVVVVVVALRREVLVWALVVDAEVAATALVALGQLGSWSWKGWVKARWS